VPFLFRFGLAYAILVGALALSASASVVQAAAEGHVASERTELHGIVLDERRSPVPAATVRALDGSGVLASAATDRDGRFVLRLPDRGREALERTGLLLRVERMGYESAERFVRAGEEVVEIHLTPAPLPLPGFQVEGVPEPCRADDADGLGRELWWVAANRHVSGLDTLGVATYTTFRSDTLSADGDWSGGRSGTGENGRPRGVAVEEQEAEMGQRGSAPILRLGWARRIQRGGYAFPVRRTDRQGSFPSWSYPPLEADLSPHFGSELFGELHHFQHLDRTAEGWLVRFCPRKADVPHLEGRLLISPDTLIRRVEWSFHTPEPDEEAGGYAVFPPADALGDPPPLLPLESMAWRSLRGEQVIRRAQWFEEWQMAPGDSVPFLPRRTEDRGGDGG
jgi:hypothetical protein